MSLSFDNIGRALQHGATRLDTELDGVPQAAVAAILTPSLEVLFIQRAHRDGDPWSGHVSFPGGRRDPGDATLLDAAIRETREEIGLELTPAQLVGELDDVGTRGGHLPALLVRPFVFAVPDVPVTRANHEVRSVHFLALAELLGGVGRGRMDWTWQGHPIVLPRVDFDGVRLWGLTLGIVDDLLHRIDGRGHGLGRPIG